ncbi:MAG: glutaminyl-peptide cyclotransferase [Myxococcales bacterium]|nr:glutaminyl-peptide cyclotransferase [Myxococcales bacterium]
MAGVQRRQTKTVRRAEQRSARALWLGLFVGALLAAGFALTLRFLKPVEETVTSVDISPAEAPSTVPQPAIEELRVRVIRTYPHATDAFTQGLIWDDGVLYESTGQYGHSSLREVRLEDGRVLRERKLEPNLFGEGLARVGDRLIQLTWRSGLAIVSDFATLERKKTLRYPGEGWGLCYDGTALVMSDGSSILDFRDPESMQLLSEVSVLNDGRPVRKLNELECVGSDVYANVWQSDEILRIDARTGRVIAIIDASGLLSRAERMRSDVLNGIAYRPQSKTFLLTGKLWPHVFEVEFVPR